MGMVVLIAMFVYALVAVAFVYLTRLFVTDNRLILGALITIAILIPTYDIILTNIIAEYCCKKEPNPKTFIKAKVENPQSIYWEDNLYPGFGAEDRKRMITKYLDGVHIKKIALNGDDGKIYVYEANEASWQAIKSVPNNGAQEYYNALFALADTIMLQTQKIYTKETMPKMNYTVSLNETKLPSLFAKFLFSDETKIINNQTNETIAYNRRYMRFFYNILPDSVGGRYYMDESMCGSWYPIERDVFGVANNIGYSNHTVDLNQKLSESRRD
jgi:hypothetical protein